MVVRCVSVCVMLGVSVERCVRRSRVFMGIMIGKCGFVIGVLHEMSIVTSIVQSFLCEGVECFFIYMLGEKMEWCICKIVELFGVASP
jgi:Enoyl-[acyl-carrier-protein] reductase (NADH)